MPRSNPGTCALAGTTAEFQGGRLPAVRSRRSRADGTVQRRLPLASESSRMAAIPAARRSRSGGSSSFQCSAIRSRSSANRGPWTGIDSDRTPEEVIPRPAGTESLSHEPVAGPRRLAQSCGFPRVNVMPSARQMASARESRGSWPLRTRRIASLGSPWAVAEPATERPASALAMVAR